MLQRLFRTKSASKDSEENYTRLLLEPEPWSPAPLADGQVRILFCQDAGDTNKTILYDSSHGLMLSPIIPAKHQQQQQRNSSYAGSGRISGGIARSWNGNDGFRANALLDRRNDCRPSSMRAPQSIPLGSDNQRQHQRQSHRRLDLIGDMIFGTAPLAYKGMNTKVHYKRDKDQQIVLSKLFTVNPQDPDVTRRTSFSSVNSDWSTTSSIAGGANIQSEPYYATATATRRSTSTFSGQSVSLDDDRSEASSDEDGRSHYSGYSVYPPILGLRPPSIRGSLYTKRSRRFSQTSMEDGVFRPMPLPNAQHVPDQPQAVQHVRTIKYAIAVIITLDEKNKALFDFIFSHFSLIENHLHQLQASAFRVLCTHFQNHDIVQHPLQQTRRTKNNLFYLESGIFQHDQAILDAAIQFKRAFYNLYGTPRIQEPLWLNMSTFPQRKSDYGQMFLKELACLINELNNESHHYFISNLVTAILMHHLSWVQTVAPPEEAKSVSCRHGTYDPLWAQLSDLYGYVGSPGRITRTVVVGKRSSLVRRILYVLTYLIRCNEVYENVESLSEPDPRNIFSQERDMDNTYVSRLEDKIVKQLIGLATDVESIAIPRAQNMPSPDSTGGNGGRTGYYPSSASPESITPEHRSSASFGSAANMFSSNRPWSPNPSAFPSDPPKVTDTHGKRVSSSLLTTGSDCSDADSLPIFEEPIVSASGVYPIPMPKTSIRRMIPDITRVRDDGIPSERADQLYAKSYGRSLMATFCETYKPDFALIGVPTDAFRDQMVMDMRNMLQQFTLSDGVTDAACLVIDTNKLRCYVLQQSIAEKAAEKQTPGVADEDWQEIRSSTMINQLLGEVKQQYSSNVVADEILDMFEDTLQLIYLKSLLLHERVSEWLVASRIDPPSGLAKIASDIR
ncbi:folliculin-interacting protein middle domain-containing protein [Dichotomocladium elegans]|nr:folliculin-interacting protein middle domain-containing protein [Dichotomocladium elegans]